MIDAFLTSQVYCRSRIGSVGPLRKIRKSPTSRPQRASKLTDALKITGQIKMPELRNQRAEQKITTEHVSNPHSPVETTQQHLLRPRGFLP